ncbi:MAG TPA: glycosyltransferase family protein [Chitinophagaceae bacterium]|nr:glycosyltransferase family protein [Chitinophagaceae bacterium]
MVGGQSSKPRIGAVIQARMKSERLPGKILMPLPFSSGKPLLGWTVECIKKSKLIDKIIIASSTDKTNDPLEAFCEGNAIELFRGSEDDVLSRFIEVTKQNGFDVVVRLTGDNPIVDAELLDFTIQHHLSNHNEYTRTKGLPLGMNFEIVSAKAFDRIENTKLKPEDREHVTTYIRNHADFKKEEFHFFKEEELDNIRLTVDYPSDFAAISLLLSLLKSGELPGLDSVREAKQNFSWILKVNEMNWQKRQFSNLTEELEAAVLLLQEKDLSNAAHLLMRHNSNK